MQVVKLAVRPADNNQQTSSNKQYDDYSTYVCSHCSLKGHGMWKCPDYVKLSIKERMELVRNTNRCENCYSGRHHTANCRSLRNWSCWQSRHNSTLCPNQPVNQQPTSSNQSTSVLVLHGATTSSNNVPAVLFMTSSSFNQVPSQRHVHLSILAVEISNPEWMSKECMRIVRQWFTINTSLQVSSRRAYCIRYSVHTILPRLAH